MRPIDADYLKAGFEEDGHLSPYIEGFINACPTVDHSSVQHGRWINCYYPPQKLTATGTMRCSVCKHSRFRITETQFVYCPHCGAKMDGGKSDAKKTVHKE